MKRRDAKAQRNNAGAVSGVNVRNRSHPEAASRGSNRRSKGRFSPGCGCKDTIQHFRASAAYKLAIGLEVPGPPCQGRVNTRFRVSRSGRSSVFRAYRAMQAFRHRFDFFYTACRKSCHFLLISLTLFSIFWSASNERGREVKIFRLIK